MSDFISTYPPTYPTIDYMTVCQANGTYGTWEIKEGVPDIRKAQEDCLKSRNNGAATKLASLEIDMPTVNLEDIAPEVKIDPNNNACATNILKGAQWLRTFCKTPDDQNVTNEYLMASCATGSLELKCFDASGTYTKKSQDPNKCTSGVYIDCDVNLSCNECKDRAALDKVLQTAYINSQCPHIIKSLVAPQKCYSSEKYLSPETGDNTSTAISTCQNNNGLLNLHCYEGGVANQVITHISRKNGWNCSGVSVAGGKVQYSGCETLNF